MEEGKTYRLEDLTIDGKGHYGIGAPAVDFDENKFTYLRITDINDDGSINYSGLKSVDDPEAGKYLLKEGDIVFARTGNSTGRSYYYEPSDGQFVFAGFLIKFSLDPVKVNPRYLKYYTHSQAYYEWVKSFDTGATRGNINAQTYGAMEISLPPRTVQDRLVEVLSSIDDKIKLNNRINHNLEEQADCLISSAIETQSIGSAHLWDICSYVTERVNNDTLNNKNYISTDNMFANKGGIGIASTIPDGKCTSFKVRDVLVSNIRPYFKKIWRASFSGGCSNDVLCFRTTKGTSSFLYHLLRSDVFFDYVMSGAKGSKMPRGDKQHIMNWTIPVFEKAIIISLEDSLEVIDDRVAIIQEENRRLSAIRDSLLPMLMTNSIYINDLTC